jgi:hypothetical protein
VGHLAVAPYSFVSAVYHQALSIALRTRNVEGLESVILTGMQSAATSGDVLSAELGRTTLQLSRSRPRAGMRPIFFVDRSASMITVLSMPEFAQARFDILRSPNVEVTAHGIGRQVRALGRQSRAADAFDSSTCRAWVEATFVAGGILVTLLAPEVKAGVFVQDTISRLLSGAIIRRIGWKTILGAGSLGGAAGKLLAPAIRTGIAKIGGGDNSDQRVRPSDLGVSPQDFREPPEGPEDIPEPRVDGPDAGVPEPTDVPTGSVEEGEGFDAIQVDGSQGFTITSQDGSGSTTTVDANGNTTVENFDAGGNTTSIETYDADGNPSRTDEPPPSQSDAGYPVPDGDGGSGGPLAAKADLIGYPNPDGDGVGGPAGAVAMLGRGATFLISGFPTIGENGILGYARHESRRSV